MAKKKSAETAVNEFKVTVMPAETKFLRGLYIQSVIFHPDVPISTFDVYVFVGDKGIVTAMVAPNFGTGRVSVVPVDIYGMHPAMAKCVVNVNNVPIRVDLVGVDDDTIDQYMTEFYEELGVTDDDLPLEEALEDDEEEDEDLEDQLAELDELEQPAPAAKKGRKKPPVEEKDELPFDEEEDVEEDEDDIDEEDDVEEDDDDVEDDEDDVEEDEEEYEDDDDIDEEEDVEEDEEDDEDVADDVEEDEDEEDEDEYEDEEIDKDEIKRILRVSSDRKQLTRIAEDLGIAVKSTWATAKLKNIISRRITE